MHSYNTSNSAYGSYIRGKTPIKYPSTSISSISGISNIRQVYNYPKGLINLKNTCYISSVLQILFQIVNISTTVYSKEISKTFSQLKKTYDKYDYMDFKKAVEKKLQFVIGNDQQDAQQFLRGLLQILNQQNSYDQTNTYSKPIFKINQKWSVKQNWIQFCKQMKKIDNSLIIQQFGSQIYQELRCYNEHKKYIFQRLMDYSLPFPSTNRVHHLNEFLIKYFQDQQLNDVQCQKCKKKTRFIKKSKFYKLPNILVLHINRFMQGYYSNKKIRNQIKFDEILQIPQKIIHEDLINNKVNSNKIRYQLFGIINHRGGLQSGHYYTQKKVQSKWFEVNDQIVTPTNIKSTENESQYAYILFYRKKI